MGMKFYNTLTGKKEEFSSIEKGLVKMYNCGPTMYAKQHIGNLSMFVFTDTLRKSLEYFGYEVDQVINITDFGHLSGDNEGNADIGEDRMTKGLKEEKMDLNLANMRVLAEKYAKIFFKDLKSLNIEIEKIKFPYASDFISSQIEMIKSLEEKEIAYKTEEGLYFDTAKFKDYGKLGKINLKGIKEGARVKKTEKRNPTDFILWKSDLKIGWQSPWGIGFPGWHIECSAMIKNILGEQIDIHTGGIEHIAIHHNNEIAQSESVTGKSPFSRFWLHRAHLKADGVKISKSAGTAIYLDDFKSHFIHPLSFRYWLLTSHYKTPANFTWEAVSGAQNAFEKIVSNFYYLPEEDETDKEIIEKFEENISDDLNTPIALTFLQEAKSKNSIKNMDKIFGLDIENISKKIRGDIPEDIEEMKKERDEARKKKNWSRSDELRIEIEKSGYVIEDTNDSSLIRRTLASLA